ncbi:hypothetical protein CC77DRAFT_1029312 [Alternaria alternata]|uniref:Uncharacterized protein n=4 Tax=Alternaria sect. Alternaria TaxID=2499237 RepID=A0A177DU86_ALTAL|nr:hypothetical protein CC77DRAFT_1029312 [Alternaria alternata]XP_028509397.1 hypothetical protein AA0111_g3006 [Alternaria arborescens]RYN27155.1 hypothetical protein AA0115_g6754 [Alternaria tenuissima]KAH6857866.1 hypothetical protein B0T12DRAFT_483225 [Alternaria alternata]OAG23294.1 hypothetical protein CC77DRAFT_1029312 [Alternaria alternata]RYN58963.1 hypothetical protein AA0114_g1572 [Alternaria tenuissima]RYN79524.1 hypothetical protein AA0117_g3795 [Alternaria alternata]
MSGHMQTSQLHRRTSRSSGSQAPCRSSRVEKTKSHHNSPKAMERRKTTTETKLYATLDDHYRMMFGVSQEEEEERPQQNRPVSWHPSSSHFQASQQTNYFEPMPHQQWSQHYSPSDRDSHHGSDFYSLSTRNSMFEPMTGASTYANTQSECGWSQHTPGYVHSSLNTPSTEALPWYLQQWAQKNQAQASSNFLPIQHPAQQDQDMEDDDGEKLVALGLYDAPEPSLSWGSLTEGTGKGLKLEETWQPPEEEEGEEEDDDASSEASVEEPSPPLPAVQQSQHLPVHVKAQTPGNMEGQSFFFDEDESVTKEWWFQQMKQPTMPVRDAGLGYGWL